MPTARMTRSEQRAANGRRLTAAARRVFLRDGFHGATLDQVAEEAGFTKGAVYSRFDSKAALFLALLDERTEQNLRQYARLADEAESARELATAIAATRGAGFGPGRDWFL